MNYSRLLNRAWQIVWNNKWLILLGMLVVLGSGGTGTPGSNAGYQFRDEDFRDFEPFRRDFAPSESWQDYERPAPAEIAGALGISMALLIPLMCVILTIAVGLWVVSTIARGGLIAGVNTIDSGGTSSFAEAWRAGWAKGWRLIGISLLPAIPILVLFFTGFGLLGAFIQMTDVLGEDVLIPAGFGLGLTGVALACLAGLSALVLDLVRTFAERACMLEDKGVFESYSRGWEVLRSNIGPAAALFLIQLGIGLVLALTSLGPAFAVMACFCFLWPLALLFDGAVKTFFSTAWTLAWREWTYRGEPPMPAV